jgi:hypothetical protein
MLRLAVILTTGKNFELRGKGYVLCSLKTFVHKFLSPSEEDQLILVRFYPK